MMINLFSIFEPLSIFNLSLNWISMILPFVFLFFNKFWLLNSNVIIMMNNLINFLIKDILINFEKKYLMMSIFIKTFIFMILFWNFMGLFPYIFTPSSHMVITFSLSMILWFSIMIFGWSNNMNHMFEHMIPMGTPMLLSVFMVLIETVSNLIRPITLAVRLTANMIAGHLLISLLSGIMENMKLLFFMILPILIMLYILEMAVAIIQSYVFTILISLYMNEI